jgi:hypothetical protein
MTTAPAAARVDERRETVVERRVFETWTIEMPSTFDETFVEEDAYWHAYDDDRSISLSSMLVESEDGPVRAESMLAVFPAFDGQPVDELPPAVLGWAVVADAIQPARASRCLQGVLAVDGRILLATITSDDELWARRVWLSIRHRMFPSRLGRRG